MVVSEPENLANLFSLYRSVGRLYKGTKLFPFNGFNLVHTEGSAWPNMCFGIETGDFDEKIVEEVTKEMERLKMRPTILLPYEPAWLGLLKQKGYFPIDQWVGMSYRGFNFPRPSESAGDGIITCLVNDPEEISEWTGVVSETLFNNNEIDPEIFGKLQEDGAELVAIKQGDELAGSSMIYFDDNGTAAVYMVGVKEKYRGKGLGGRLMNTCLRRISEAGIDKCYLQATRTGLPFYKTLGFEQSDKYLILCKIK